MKVKLYKGQKLIEFTFSSKDIQNNVVEIASYRSKYLAYLIKRYDNCKVIFKSGFSDSARYRARKQGIDLPKYRHSAEVFFKELGSFKNQKTLMFEVATSIKANFIENYDENSSIDMGSDKLLGKLTMLDIQFRKK